MVSAVTYTASKSIDMRNEMYFQITLVSFAASIQGVTKI